MKLILDFFFSNVSSKLYLKEIPLTTVRCVTISRRRAKMLTMSLVAEGLNTSKEN